MDNERSNPHFPLETRGFISYHNAGFRQLTPQGFRPLMHLTPGEVWHYRNDGYNIVTYADWLDLTCPVSDTVDSNDTVDTVDSE